MSRKRNLLLILIILLLVCLFACSERENADDPIEKDFSDYVDFIVKVEKIGVRYFNLLTHR